MPFILSGRRAEPPRHHMCRPPTRWPWLSRRRHPSGSVWECDHWVPWGQGTVPRGSSDGFQYCGRRWRLTWTPNNGSGGPHHLWAEITPKRPGTPPAGRGGAISPSTPPTSLKMLAEDLCRHQSRRGWPSDVDQAISNLLMLILEHRPVGPNGKHDNRHTATCGCEDEEAS